MSEEKPTPKVINEQLNLADNLKAEKIEAKVATDYLSIGTDEAATPSSPATPSQPAAPPVPKESSDPASLGGVDSGSKVITPRTADLHLGGSPDSALKRTADGIATGKATMEGVGEAVQALARLRPVEVMLRDPLGEVARKERRSLLGISAIAILVGWTGLVPKEIQNFGITFTTPERKALLWLFLAVVGYYTAAFAVYAWNDFMSWVYAMYLGRQELKKRRDEQRGAGSITPDAPKPLVDTPWSLISLVTPTSVVRGVFDFCVPLAVVVVAMYALWGAVHQVAPTTPAAPAPPASAPAVPHGPAPSLKAIPHR